MDNLFILFFSVASVLKNTILLLFPRIDDYFFCCSWEKKVGGVTICPSLANGRGFLLHLFCGRGIISLTDLVFAIDSFQNGCSEITGRFNDYPFCSFLIPQPWYDYMDNRVPASCIAMLSINRKSVEQDMTSNPGSSPALSLHAYLLGT
jgi:hypothetical protein